MNMKIISGDQFAGWFICIFMTVMILMLVIGMWMMTDMMMTRIRRMNEDDEEDDNDDADDDFKWIHKGAMDQRQPGWLFELL